MNSVMPLDADAQQTSPAALLRRAAVFADARGVDQYTVVLSVELSATEAQRFLDDNPGASLVSPPSSALAPAYRGRVGSLATRGHREIWHLPERPGAMLIVVTDASHVSFFNALHAWLRRCRTIALLTPGGSQVRSAAALLASRAVLYLFSLLRRALGPLLVRLLIRPLRRMAGWLRTAAVRQLYRKSGYDIAERASSSRLGMAASAWLSRRFDVLPCIAEEARSAPISAYAPVKGRIVLATPSLTSGGAERQVVLTIKGLLERGHRDVVLLCEHLRQDPALGFFEPTLTAAGVRIFESRDFLDKDDWPGPVRLSATWHALMRRLQRGPHAARVLSFARAFEVLRPEVLHAWQDHTNMVAGVAAVMVGVPTIILSGRNVSPIHFPHLFRFYMRETYRGLLGNPHVRMTNNSQGGADDYARWLGVDPQRIAVIRNGVDAAGLRRLQAPEADRFRRECGIPAAAPVVGAVFRFHPEKRPLLWVEVATRVARANDAVHFLLVGNGPMKTAVMNRAAKTGLRRRLHVLAADASVERAFSILDVLLLTSTFEGTPNVAIEAQLLGVPAIVTPGGGSPEVVRDGETGVVVDPPTAENLAAAVLKAIDDQAWRQRAARSGPDFVRERFGADRMIRDTLASYGLAAQRDQ